MNNILVFDLIILIYKSINSDKRTKKHLIIFITRSTTELPALKKTLNLFKELETDLNPESINPSNNKQ
jgi:hypothetical protein